MKWDAEKYLKHSKIQFRIGKIALDKLNPQKSENILDIGCGTGNISALIAETVENGTVVGIDIDDNMIQESRKRITNENIENLEVRKISANELNYHNKFDAVFSNIVFHWINDIENLMKKIYKSLKSSGRLVFSTIYSDPNVPIEITTKEEIMTKDIVKISGIELRYMKEFMEKGYYTGILTIEEFLAYQSKVNTNNVYKTITIEEFKRILDEAGFKNIIIEPQYFTNEIDDLEVYFEYRQSNLWTYFLSFFPERHRKLVAERLKDLTKKEWDAVPVEKREFPIKEKWPVLFIRAEK